MTLHSSPEALATLQTGCHFAVIVVQLSIYMKSLKFRPAMQFKCVLQCLCLFALQPQRSIGSSILALMFGATPVDNGPILRR